MIRWNPILTPKVVGHSRFQILFLKIYLYVTNWRLGEILGFCNSISKAGGNVAKKREGQLWSDLSLDIINDIANRPTINCVWRAADITHVQINCDGWCSIIISMLSLRPFSQTTTYCFQWWYNQRNICWDGSIRYKTRLGDFFRILRY